MPTPFTIVFDLDGTLVDTAGDLVATTNLIIADQGCAPLPMEIARPLIGNGARALLERGLQLSGARYDDTRLALMTERFIQHYSAHIADHTTVDETLLGLLDSFTAKGLKLAVCTNKRTPLAKQLLSALSIEHYFAAVIGSGELAFSKPDPRMLQVAVSECGGAIDHAVMVGDSAVDVATARAAIVPVILVDFGYTSIPARELGADLVISHWNELWPALCKLAPSLHPA